MVSLLLQSKAEVASGVFHPRATVFTHSNSELQYIYVSLQSIPFGLSSLHNVSYLLSGKRTHIEFSKICQTHIFLVLDEAKRS